MESRVFEIGFFLAVIGTIVAGATYRPLILKGAISTLVLGVALMALDLYLLPFAKKMKDQLNNK